MIDVRQRLELFSGQPSTYHSFPLLEKTGIARISRLPVSIRILLESVLRNTDGQPIRDEEVEALARWQPKTTTSAPYPPQPNLRQPLAGDQRTSTTAPTSSHSRCAIGTSRCRGGRGNRAPQ